jgi:tetratricopeptide (TPR) repeat protein
MVGLLATGLAIAAVAVVFWRSRRPDFGPDRIGEVRQQATDLLREHRLAEARPLIESLLARPEADDNDRMLLGLLLKDEKRPDESLKVLESISDDFPKADIVHFLRGQIERERDRAGKAEVEFLRSLELNPSLLAARNELIYLYGMETRRKALAEQFRALEGIRPLNYSEVFLWCLTRRIDWDPLGTYKELSRYVAADPGDREALLAFADCLRQLTRFDEGIQALEPLPESDADARALRARIAYDSGDVPRAEELLKEGPHDHPLLARLRGRLALNRRDWEGAIGHFRAALTADPDDRDSLFGLGLAMEQLGRPVEAAPYLEQARRLDHLSALVEKAANEKNRDDPQLVRDLAAACEALGRKPEARAWYRILIERDPLDQDAQRALYRLRDDK